MLLDQKAMAEIPEWEYRYVSLVLIFFRSSLACLPTLSPIITTYSHHFPPRSQAIKDSLCASPDDASRAGAPKNKDAPIILQAEGHHPTANRIRDVASKTLEISPHPPPFFAFPLTLGLPPTPIPISPPVYLPL